MLLRRKPDVKYRGSQALATISPASGIRLDCPSTDSARNNKAYRDLSEAALIPAALRHVHVCTRGLRSAVPATNIPIERCSREHSRNRLAVFLCAWIFRAWFKRSVFQQLLGLCDRFDCFLIERISRLPRYGIFDNWISVWMFRL